MTLLAGFLLCCVGLVISICRRVISGVAFFSAMTLHFYASDFLSDRLYYTSSAALCVALIMLVSGVRAKWFIFLAFAALLTNVLGFVMYEMGEGHFVYNLLFTLIYFAGCVCAGTGIYNTRTNTGGACPARSSGGLC